MKFTNFSTIEIFIKIISLLESKCDSIIGINITKGLIFVQVRI